MVLPEVAIARLNMANERTLLAWVRTVLAIMRTAFATMGMVGVTAGWEMVQKFSTILVTTLMCATMIVGIYRYYKINQVVFMKSVPSSFHRTKVWPVVYILGLSVFTIAVSCLANGIE